MTDPAENIPQPKSGPLVNRIASAPATEATNGTPAPAANVAPTVINSLPDIVKFLAAMGNTTILVAVGSKEGKLESRSVLCHGDRGDIQKLAAAAGAVVAQS